MKSIEKNQTNNYLDILSNIGFTTAYGELLEKVKKSTITFGVDSLDKLFTLSELNQSGLQIGDKYEFYGSHKTGKTQICHQLCVTIQLPEEMGGLNKKAIYIDTEGSFSPSRISQVARHLKLEKGWDKDTREILSDVLTTRVKHTTQQKNKIKAALKYIRDYPDLVGLVIVDSLTAHFRAEYPDRSHLTQRQKELVQHLKLLDEIISEGVTVIITNQVYMDPNNFSNNYEVGLGGSVLSHWSTTRCHLRKSKGEKRIIRIVDSPVLPENEAVFEITSHGIGGK